MHHIVLVGKQPSYTEAVLSEVTTLVSNMLSELPETVSSNDKQKTLKHTMLGRNLVFISNREGGELTDIWKYARKYKKDADIIIYHIKLEQLSLTSAFKDDLKSKLIDMTLIKEDIIYTKSEHIINMKNKALAELVLDIIVYTLQNYKTNFNN